MALWACFILHCSIFETPCKLEWFLLLYSLIYYSNSNTKRVWNGEAVGHLGNLWSSRRDLVRLDRSKSTRMVILFYCVNKKADPVGENDCERTEDCWILGFFCELQWTDWVWRRRRGMSYSTYSRRRYRGPAMRYFLWGRCNCRSLLPSPPRFSTTMP
jgi:hypothetical protein